MADIVNSFRIVILLQLFFSCGITLISYSMPNESLQYVDIFTAVGHSIGLNEIGQKVENSLQTTTTTPIIEVGALVFYTGNILLDLLLNFAFAIPEMIGLIVNGLMMLFSFDSYFFVTVQLFAFICVMITYFIGLIQLLTNLRTGRIV